MDQDSERDSTDTAFEILSGPFRLPSSICFRALPALCPTSAAASSNPSALSVSCPPIYGLLAVIAHDALHVMLYLSLSILIEIERRSQD